MPHARGKNQNPRIGETGRRESPAKPAGLDILSGGHRPEQHQRRDDGGQGVGQQEHGDRADLGAVDEEKGTRARDWWRGVLARVKQVKSLGRRFLPRTLHPALTIVARRRSSDKITPAITAVRGCLSSFTLRLHVRSKVSILPRELT